MILELHPWTGKPRAGSTHFLSADARLPLYIDWPGNDVDCWEWMGARDGKGYGHLRVGKVLELAHRLVYEALVGPIPDGLSLDHLCRNPRCVNPAHLEPVTHRVNVLRGEGFAARNARKTHCIHGHEFTPENTYRPPSRPDERGCRACMDRRAVARQRGAVNNNQRRLTSA